MYRWYRNARSCYAYLADVSIDGGAETVEGKIEGSRWFTRGWTLQELVAPANVEFYSKDWESLGSKSDLHALLTEITGIEERVLRTGFLEDVSIAKRMSWAARRRTTRVEDRAYSLLGIFDVNMPLLYGEGIKAFIRLQEEIMRVSDDQSLFAWGLPPKDRLQSMEFYSTAQGFPEAYTDLSSSKRRALREERLFGLEGRRPVGLLATSPDEFANSHRISPVRTIDDLVSDMPPIATNKGIRIELPFFPHAFAFRPQGDLAEYRYDCKTCYDEAWLSFAIIACCDEFDRESTLGIPLLAWSRRRFARLGSPIQIPATRWPSKGITDIIRTLLIKEPDGAKLEKLASKFAMWKMPSQESAYSLTSSAFASHAEYNRGRRLLTVPDRSHDRQLHAAFYFTHKSQPGFAIVLGGRPDAGLPDGPWAACVVVGGDLSGRRASRTGEDSTAPRERPDNLRASWNQVSAIVQKTRIEDHGISDSLLAQLWRRKSHRFREVIYSNNQRSPAQIWVVEVDMSLAAINFAEMGVYVEINISSTPGLDFDEKRKRPTLFPG